MLICHIEIFLEIWEIVFGKVSEHARVNYINLIKNNNKIKLSINKRFMNFMFVLSIKRDMMNMQKKKI